MKILKLSSGFSAVLVALIIAAVGIFGFVGYKGYELIRENMAVDEAAKIQPAVAEDAPVVEDVVEIVDGSDLDEINTMMEEMDVEDTTDVDLLTSEMASF